MCGSLIKGPKKASKGWLNEIDSTEKGEKKRKIVVREKNEIRVVLSNFLVDLTETKFVGCSGCKKMSLVVFKEQPEYTSNRSRMYFSDRTYILD